MVRFLVAGAVLVLFILQSTEGEQDRRLPPGMNVPQRPASRVSMDTLNTINKLAPPKPSPWPAAFSVSFATNLTEKEWTHEGAFPPHAVKGKLWYDSVRGQRVQHGSGSRECSKFYSTEGNCSLVFNNDGMYAVVPEEARCCLDLPGLHVPPANWTQAAHKFVGTQRIGGRMCHGFRYLPGGVLGLQGTLHEYWQDAVSQLPCLFTFPGEPRMAWLFDAASVHVQAQDAALFAVPDACKGSACSARARKAAREEAKAEAEELWRALYEEEAPAMASLIEEVLQGLTEEQKAKLELQARRKTQLEPTATAGPGPAFSEPLTI